MTDSLHDAPTSSLTTPAMTLRPIGLRWARDFAFHLAGLATSIVAFVLWVTAASITLSLLIFVVGLFVALASFYCFRWFARIERHRAAIVLGAPIPERYREAPPGSGWFARLRTLTLDPATWKDVSWTVVHSVVGFCFSVAVISIWGSVLSLVTMPAWYWSVEGGSDWGFVHVDSLPLALLCTLAGLLLTPVAGWLTRAFTLAELAMMGPLLRPSRATSLDEPVASVAPPVAVPVPDPSAPAPPTAPTAAPADGAPADRRDDQAPDAPPHTQPLPPQTARDLHEETQTRLVALALDPGSTTASRPRAPSERGLGAAVHALASASPLAVAVEADLPEQLPAAVEAVAERVVAEALANAAEHSRALRVLVRLRTARSPAGDRLAVDVSDDGAGGADPAGGGLLGLRRRVEALGGTLVLVSPVGRGTTLRAELPCA